jgi:DNA-binding MarR family transcriptional regulator
MAKTNKVSLSSAAWQAFHDIRITLLPPLVKHLSEECELSEAEYQVLVTLRSAEKGLLKPTQIAENLGWDIGRVSHQVSRMEAKGLLERQQCPSDARSCWIGMTADGKNKIKKALPIQMREVDKLFSEALTEEQFQSLIEISEAIKKNVSEKLKAD